MNPLHPLRRRVASIAKLFSRRWYWELRAKDIDERWGQDSSDFPAVQGAIELVKARTLIDIGCGAGRLFPAYVQAGVQEVTGQDVSRWALAKARERFPQPMFRFTGERIEQLKPRVPFDLCVSNRVLSAVPPGEISETLRHVAGLARHIYLNEYSLSDEQRPSDYWFLHDYLELLGKHVPFTVLHKGSIGTATYYVLRID